jgi:hypothetical protein
MSNRAGAHTTEAAFFERHRVSGALLGLAVLVLVGMLVGEVVGNAVVRLVDLGVGMVAGG